MKVMVGFVVWNKVDMLAWLLQGVNIGFPDAKNTEVVFCFDKCTDDCTKAWAPLKSHWLLQKGYQARQIVSDK